MKIPRAHNRLVDQRRLIGFALPAFDNHRNRRILVVAIVSQWNRAEVPHGRFLDSRHLLAATKDFAEKWRLLGRRRVVVVRRNVWIRYSRLDRHYVLRIESELRI